MRSKTQQIPKKVGFLVSEITVWRDTLKRLRDPLARRKKRRTLKARTRVLKLLEQIRLDLEEVS